MGGDFYWVCTAVMLKNAVLKDCTAFYVGSSVYQVCRR